MYVCIPKSNHRCILNIQCIFSIHLCLLKTSNGLLNIFFLFSINTGPTTSVKGMVSEMRLKTLQGTNYVFILFKSLLWKSPNTFWELTQNFTWSEISSWIWSFLQNWKHIQGASVSADPVSTDCYLWIWSVGRHLCAPLSEASPGFLMPYPH